jgi:hypothetical protein
MTAGNCSDDKVPAPDRSSSCRQRDDVSLTLDRSVLYSHSLDYFLLRYPLVPSGNLELKKFGRFSSASKSAWKCEVWKAARKEAVEKNLR